MQSEVENLFDHRKARHRAWRDRRRHSKWRIAAFLLAVLTGGWLALDGMVAAFGETLSGPLLARVVEVVDGDTLAVRVRIWLDNDVTTRVRLDGIDAPELRGACPEERELARRAAEFLVAKVMAAGEGGTEVRLRDVRYGKYARRVVARVETEAGEDLGRALLDAGLARPYGGGRRLSWCEASAKD